jgi:hypothetical protein
MIRQGVAAENIFSGLAKTDGFGSPDIGLRLVVTMASWRTRVVFIAKRK